MVTRLVYHDLRLGLMAGLRGLVLLLRVVTHFNIVVTLAGFILIQFILIVITLLFQVLTLSVRDIFLLIFLASGTFAALHILVFTLALVGIFELLDKSGLQLTFFSAVGVAIILQIVGLGLVRRVLGRSGLLGIPLSILA